MITLSSQIKSQIIHKAVTCIIFVAGIGTASAQDVFAPPSIGDETKGTPAVVEEEQAVVQTEEVEAEPTPRDQNAGLFASPQVTESRRENGQIYRIELEHPLGSKQVIEETDSDGKIESTSNDLEETPNLPKWKLGSW